MQTLLTLYKLYDNIYTEQNTNTNTQKKRKEDHYEDYI